MADVAATTDLAPSEAPFVWVWLALGSVAFAYSPVIYVFQNSTRRRQWRDYFGAVPSVTACNYIIFYFMLFAFGVTTGLSYWLCRAGKTRAETEPESILFGITLSLFSWWSWPALFYLRFACTALLVGAFGVYVAYVVLLFVKNPWYVGLTALVGVLILAVMLFSWLKGMKRRRRKAAVARHV